MREIRQRPYEPGSSAKFRGSYGVEVLRDGKWTNATPGLSSIAASKMFVEWRRSGAIGVRVRGLGLFIDRRGGLHQERRREARRKRKDAQRAG